MSEINIKKIIGESPKDAFEAIDKMNKAHQELLSAIHIIKSALDFPETSEAHQFRMKQLIDKYI